MSPAMGSVRLYRHCDRLGLVPAICQSGRLPMGCLGSCWAIFFSAALGGLRTPTNKAPGAALPGEGSCGLLRRPAKRRFSSALASCSLPLGRITPFLTLQSESPGYSRFASVCSGSGGSARFAVHWSWPEYGACHPQGSSLSVVCCWLLCVGAAGQPGRTT